MTLWLRNSALKRVWISSTNQIIYRQQGLKTIESNVSATITIKNPNGAVNTFTERDAPFAPPWQIPLGSSEIRITPFDQMIAGEKFTLNMLGVVPPEDFGKLPKIEVFLIEDKDLEKIIQRLMQSGANTFDLAHLPAKVSFSIRRTPLIGSFSYDFTGMFQADPSNEPWTPRPGKASLIIKPYSGEGFIGAIGDPLTFPFEIVGSPIVVDPTVEGRLSSLESKFEDLKNRIKALESTNQVRPIRMSVLISPGDGEYTFTGKDAFEISGIKVPKGRAQRVKLIRGGKYTVISTNEVYYMGPGVSTITQLI